MKNNYFSKKVLTGMLCAVIALGSMLLFPQFGMKAEAHSCTYRWVTISEGSGYGDLYEKYECEVCGDVAKINYMRSELYVRDRLYRQIEGAGELGVVTSDFGLFHTVHDDLFVLLCNRNDVTAVVTYQYQGRYYQTIFPAGADYREFLQDDVTFYGMPGLNGRCGIVTSAGGEVLGDLSEVDKLEGTELLCKRIELAPEQGYVYFDFKDNHSVNDKLFNALFRRGDVTVIVVYKYKDVTYQTTFPAGADYSEFLKDSVQFYGMLGLNGRCGIATAVRE